MIPEEYRTCRACGNVGDEILHHCVHCLALVCSNCWVAHSAQHRKPVVDLAGRAMIKPTPPRPTKEQKAATAAAKAVAEAGQLVFFGEQGDEQRRQPPDRHQAGPIVGSHESPMSPPETFPRDFLKMFPCNPGSFVVRKSIGTLRDENGKLPAEYVTICRAVTEGDVKLHLAGSVCLVLKPDLADGTCSWAQIDHDIYLV